MTRSTDVFVPVNDRPRIANDANADAFVSIHCNAATNRDAQGTETWAFSATSQGAVLANAMHPAMIRRLGRRDRGVRFQGFAVLQLTRMPACLLELAFISNAEEERLLANAGFQQLAATAINEGLQAWRAPPLRPAPLPPGDDLAPAPPMPLPPGDDLAPALPMDVVGRLESVASRLEALLERL